MEVFLAKGLAEANWMFRGCQQNVLASLAEFGC